MKCVQSEVVPLLVLPALRLHLLTELCGVLRRRIDALRQRDVCEMGAGPIRHVQWTAADAVQIHAMSSSSG